mgnify:CR=1 FL=1
MKQMLGAARPRSIVLLPDGRVGVYAYRYVRDDGRAVGRVLVQETRGATTPVELDVLTTVDTVRCDPQTQETLWRLVAVEA